MTDFPNWIVSRLAAPIAVACLAVGCATDTRLRQDGRDHPTTARVALEEPYTFTISDSARISQSARSIYNTALITLRNGDLTRGISQLESVLKENPRLVFPRIDLATAYRNDGNLAAALGQLEGALLLSPDNPLVLAELGLTLRSLGEFDAARGHYERALAVYPGYHFAERNLAVLCDLYLNDLECADRHYRQSLVSAPDPNVEQWLANVEARRVEGGEE